jgi:CubicO group peptidase (beta-lactamase class C family)
MMPTAFTPSALPQDLGFSPDRLRRADDLVERFIREGKLPGAVTLVARRGQVCHLHTHGWRDMEAGSAMRADALFRIYSMTKIITTVALLTLYERGLLDVNDPVSRHLEGFQGLPVQLADGSQEPSERDVTIYDLLRHCAGFQAPLNADALRASGHDLESLAREYSTKPLVAQPGRKWLYGVSTDILARIVEVVSGRPFDAYLREEIFQPLGMRDAGYYVEDARAERLCVCYRHSREGELSVQDGTGPDSPYRADPRLKNGGLGLVCSTEDYYRFATMLLNGGRLGEARILGRKTVELMTLDHLPREHPNLSIGTQCFRFGLGVSVVTDVAASRCLSSLGEFGWGGAAGTQVWINPREEMVVMIMIQVRADVPTGIMDIYKRLVYQALV